MSQNQWATYSGQQLAASFAQEADAFGAIAMSPGFENLLTQYHDYDSFLQTLNNDSNRKRSVDTLLSNNGIIDTAIPTQELAQIFCQAQIAACAELFNGWRINSSQFSREGILALAKQGSEGLVNIPAIPIDIRPDQYSESQRQLLNGVNVIQNIDTVRIMQVLKLLGLITCHADETHQLSLGVGNGYRDLFGIHLTPRITTERDASSTNFYFETIEKRAAHTVLIDNDPVYKSHFDTLNREEGGRVLALNNDADLAFKLLEIEQKESNLMRRNMVACLRLDYRMIPDEEIFLRSTYKVIDEKADLIMTIGAGNNLEELEGRLKCFDNLFSILTERELKPVRILLHGKGSAAEQRSQPNFGQLAYASYQILYCKLDRACLK